MDEVAPLLLYECKDAGITEGLEEAIGADVEKDGSSSSASLSLWPPLIGLVN